MTMSGTRTSLFCFSNRPNGYFMHNGKKVHGSGIPESMAIAMGRRQLQPVKSITISPEGGWVACFKEDAAERKGPQGRDWIGADVPGPLLTHLTQTAHQNHTNPILWVKIGPADQYFGRRDTGIFWKLNSPLERSLRKLMALGLHDRLEEMVIGPNDTAIYIFNNGSFLWDLDPASEPHRILQRNFLKGSQLEAAALSFVDDDYFFFWGHGDADFQIARSEHPRIQDAVSNCVMTRMQYNALHGTAMSVPPVNRVKYTNALFRTIALYQKQQQADFGFAACLDFYIGGLTSWSNGRNVKDVTSFALQFLDRTPLPRRRNGTGNLREWSDIPPRWL